MPAKNYSIIGLFVIPMLAVLFLTVSGNSINIQKWETGNLNTVELAIGFIILTGASIISYLMGEMEYMVTAWPSLISILILPILFAYLNANKFAGTQTLFYADTMVTSIFLLIGIYGLIKGIRDFSEFKTFMKNRHS